jgi:hypothetical protein
MAVYKDFANNDPRVVECIRIVKEALVKNIGNMRGLSKIIDETLIPHTNERKDNAEVSTPYVLRQEMLDKIPVDFWTTPKTVFEPCCGKGGFLIDIVDRFMSGLTIYEPDEQLRFKLIVEECLYFADINTVNIYICDMLIAGTEDITPNYYIGDTLEMDISTAFPKLSEGKFDAVIGNPPYNSSGAVSIGNTIWQKFVKASLDEWLNDAGYLCFVHPPGWRKPCYNKSQLRGLFELMTHNNHMLYVSIHNTRDGMITFNAGTRYDWYIIQKTDVVNETTVCDEDGNRERFNMREMTWLPNKNIRDIVEKLYGNPPVRIMMDSAYHATRDYVSNDRNEEYKYPCVHSTPKGGNRFKYSNRNDRGHFGVSKIIFGESGIGDIIVDIEGEYGMTQGAMAILVDSQEEANALKVALMCDEFGTLLKSMIVGNFRIDWNIFKSFRRDFWREFIPAE